MPNHFDAITDLTTVCGGANPLNVTADKLSPGLINLQNKGTSFQPVNCVRASEALPNAPAALKDSWVCTNNGATVSPPAAK